MTKYSFISPHFDDAILSCGAMMVKEDNTEIITVFSGAPININITEYDKKCGFKSSFEAMNERALENNEAIKTIGIKENNNLGYHDGQYHVDREKDYKNIYNDLNNELLDSDIVVAPVGILHEDHKLVRDIIIDLYTKTNQKWELWFYEEMPYRIVHPIEAQLSLNYLSVTFDLRLITTNSFDDSYKLKLEAIKKYKSQYNTGDIVENNLISAERFWKVLW